VKLSETIYGGKVYAVAASNTYHIIHYKFVDMKYNIYNVAIEYYRIQNRISR